MVVVLGLVVGITGGVMMRGLFEMGRVDRGGPK